MNILKDLRSSDGNKDIRNQTKKIGFVGIVFLAEIVYFFVGFFNSYALFAAPLCLITAIYVSNRFLITKDGGKVSICIKRQLRSPQNIKARHLWILALIGLLVGFAQGSWKMGNLRDLIVITCCVLVILDPPATPNTYKTGLKLIAAFGLFYAASIWVQMLLPDVYEVYLNALENGSDTRINKFANYYTGFTTHPSHTATYIAAGMLAFAQFFQKGKWKLLLVEAFLTASLLCAGMRMPVIAVFLAILFLLFMQTPREKRKKICVGIFVCGVLVLCVTVVFIDQLRAIPLIGRMMTSVETLLNGGDVTSGRSKLYRHAWELFLQNPIVGIGWGNYRNTVVGTVTYETPFDVHNIFLQLLCETGIVGFVCFIIPMAYSLIGAIRYFGHLLNEAPQDPWRKPLGFSCAFQIYFLIFGITDNPLYSVPEQIFYLISCSVVVAYLANNGRENLHYLNNVRGRKKKI